jgi:hypothetical protein
MSDVYCPKCCLVVAPQAPDRRVHNGVTYHAFCLTRILVRTDVERRTGKPVRMTFEVRRVLP